MAKAVRISLANKCQLLFGGAVVLILTAALAVGWYRMRYLVFEGQEETARKLTQAWLEDLVEPGGRLRIGPAAATAPARDEDLSLALVPKEDFEVAARGDPFLRQALARFQRHGDRNEDFLVAKDAQRQYYFRYARAVRKSDLARLAGGAGAGFTAGVDTSAVANPVEAVLLVQLRGDLATRQVDLNGIYVVAAGLLAGLIAIAVFWFITTRMILSPLAVLRDTAAKVSEGDLNIRADLNTGDEFEQLAEMFNTTLENLKQNQDQLRSVNKSLDLKLGELAETNVSLYEANKIKGEFLANVSHEFRTPLNSIIGFADLVLDSLKDSTNPADEKRQRYAANIITGSRRLLDLINELLDLAKIEAGRMEVHVAPMSISDTAEGLLNLMRPQAEKRQIELVLKVEPNIPLVQTDAGKFQQVLFNFLSNAIKFTPAGGTVTLSAALVPADGAPPAPPAPPGSGANGAASAGNGAGPTHAADAAPCLCISVADTGPGIPADQQDRIFEKFTQLDSTVTREHGGTGLGLAISRELARLLHGEIRLHSVVGQGATFSLLMPLVLESKGAPLMPEAPVTPAGAAAGA